MACNLLLFFTLQVSRESIRSLSILFLFCQIRFGIWNFGETIVMLRKLFFVVLFIYLQIATSYVAKAIPIHVVDSEGKEITVIHSITKEQAQYISLDELFRVLSHKVDSEIKHQYIAITRHLTLNIKGKRIDFRMGQTNFTVEYEETHLLSSPPVVIDNKPMIPVEFITEFASQLFGFRAKLNKTAQILRIIDEEAEPEEPEYTTEDIEAFLLIIDPGHGGKDTGTKSRSGLVEKNLTLKLAQQLEEVCRNNQIRVKLTRNTDRNLSPQQRADIANKSSAELFISIHFNASFLPKQSGFRIYINKPISISSDSSEYQESEEEPKIKKFSQAEFLEQSREVAQWIAEELQSVKLSGNIVEVPLVTLRRVYMPAVLVELAYLSNFTDEAKISDQDTVDRIVSALFRVVQKFNQSN